MKTPEITRRAAIEVFLLATGCLVVGCKSIRGGSGVKDQGADAVTYPFNAWIRIDKSGHVYFYLDRVEMGQGTMTSHAAMVAEELDVPPASLRIDHAPPGLSYLNGEYFLQITGGSSSVAESWRPLRKAAAATRDLLLRGGASLLGVSVSSCYLLDGKVLSREKAGSVDLGLAAEMASSFKNLDLALGPIFGPIALASLSANSWIGAEPKKGPFATYKYIGKSIPRVDVPAKVSGKAEFGIDVEIPGLLQCLIVRNPAIGGEAGDVDRVVLDEAFLKKYRLTRVFRLEKKMPTMQRGGVAFVGTSFWHCMKAAEVVSFKWPKGPVPITEASLFGEQQALIGTAGAVVNQSRGDGGGTDGKPERYRVPHLPHQTMEPPNCTVDYPTEPRPGGPKMTIWTGTQLPSGALELASQVSGLDHNDITVNTTLLGGGFGRRITQDYVGEAVWVAREMRQPVKVIWTREDDLRHDFFRPASYHEIAGTVDNGKITGWQHKLVGASVLKSIGRHFANSLAPNFVPTKVVHLLGSAIENLVDFKPELDFTSHEGAKSIPYRVKGVFECRYVYHDTKVPLGFWRGVGHPASAFVVESYIDELAHAAHADPVGFRHDHLYGDEGKRLDACLSRAAQMAKYQGAKGAEGVGYGVATHACFKSYCAMIIKVRVDRNKRELRLEDVWAVMDCGKILNPAIVRAQVESAVIFGLSAALKQEITFGSTQPGVVDQTNYHNCDILRMFECPNIYVDTIVSDADPTGVGEIAVPPTAPALTNAIFNAIGERIRELPILRTAKMRLV